MLPDDEWLRRFPARDDSRPEQLRAIYDAEIAFVDHQLGRLLAGFRRARRWERSVVTVLADHGEGLGDHDLWSHGVLYQEQIRVPLVIRAPGLAPGSRIAPLVRSVDLVPTLLELAGIGPQRWPRMDGESLLPALRDGRLPVGRLAYSDSLNMLRYARADDPRRQDDKLYSLFDGRFKLIHHQLRPERSELFDLAGDPGELRNLAATSPGPMRALRRRLEELGALSDLLPAQGEGDSERARRLRSLGYLE